MEIAAAVLSFVHLTSEYGVFCYCILLPCRRLKRSPVATSIRACSIYVCSVVPQSGTVAYLPNCQAIISWPCHRPHLQPLDVMILASTEQASGLLSISYM